MKLPAIYSAPFLCLILLYSASALAVEDQEPYEEIRIFLPDPEARRELLRHPELEVMGLGDGDIRLLSRSSVTRRLIEDGWAVEVLHPDLEAFYAARSKAATGNGPWVSYNEMVAELNLLHAEYPQIASSPFSIGETWEGREIWAIWISDNPDLDEGEPEVLFDSAHHAREIMTVELTLYYARYLCENYATDPFVRDLVDERRIAVVPIVNPDGFVYNETTNPSGGGMWRKNRHDDFGGCVGVDINRNYPYRWGGDGSSSDPCSQIHRGRMAMSEPETMAMIDLIRSHRFVTHNSIHSVVGTILIPWCYTDEPTPDDALLRTMAVAMTAENGYSIGQCPEILYVVSGGAIDWAYGDETSKSKIFSFTTEIGGTGFWPAYAEREGLLRENLHSMLYLTQVAGPALRITGTDVVDAGDDGRIDPGETIDLHATVENSGVVAESGEVSLRLRCDDPYVQLLTAVTSGHNIPAQGSYTNEQDPLRFVVESSAPPGRELEFTLEVSTEWAPRLTEPFVLRVARLDEIVHEDFEEPVTDWIVDESHTAATGAFVRIAPNGTTYQPGEDASGPDGTFAWVTGQNEDEATDDVDEGIAATRTRDYDLSGYDDVRLSMQYFHGQRDGGDDPEGDWFRIDLSSDGGRTWTNVVEIGDQTSAPVWRELTVPLRAFIELTDRVRIRVQASDGPGDGDLIEAGIDEFYLLAGTGGNHRPEAPEILFPPDGATHVPGFATLRITNADDEDGDRLEYGIRIFADSDLTTLVDEAEAIPAGEVTATWTVNERLDVGTYYWRCYAADPVERSLYGPIASFSVTDSSYGLGDPPTAAPGLMAGPNPAKGIVKLRYRVPASTTSEIAIYDLEGRKVRRFAHGTGGPGWRELTWDGKNDAGLHVANGIYWVRLWTPKETRTVQIVRVE